MARFESDTDARMLGDALARLRRERGFSQAEAGARAGMTSQGWGLYEAGRRPGLFRPDVQRRLTAALDATPETLALLLAAGGRAPETAPADGLRSSGRPFLDSETGAPRRLQLSNDDLAPWAASGVVVEYAPGRWPRRGQGCVIETEGAAPQVRLYERADGEFLYVLGPGLAGEEAVPRAAVRAVSAVVARLER